MKWISLLKTCFSRVAFLYKKAASRASGISTSNPNSTDKLLANTIRKLLQLRYRLSTVIFSLMLLLVFIPLLAVGTISYFRSRALLRDHTTTQLQILAETNGEQLDDFSLFSQQVLAGLGTQKNLTDSIAVLLRDPNSQEKQILTQYQLVSALSSYRTVRNTFAKDVFDHLILLSSDGRVLASTNNEWRKIRFNELVNLNSLLGNNQSVGLFNPSPLYSNQFVLFSSHKLSGSKYQEDLTLIGTSRSVTTVNLLNNASTFMVYAHAYLLTIDGQLLTVSPGKNEVIQVPPDQEHVEQIRNLIDKNQKQGTIRTENRSPKLAYIKWLPESQMALIIEVPESYIYRIISIFDTYNISALAIALIITGLVIFVTITNLINPLSLLTQQAKSFAQGDLSQRSRINRKDEIGQLAASFNQMGDELQEIYHSLETRVASRIAQINLATQIAQKATQNANREVIAQVAVDEITRIFGFSFASIFIVNEANQTAVLEAATRTQNQNVLKRGLQIPIINESLLGFVIANKQPYLAADAVHDHLSQKEILLPESVSEIGIPILFTDRVIGLLEVQSTSNSAFDAEAISLLQTLANQISTGFQSLNLIEETQTNLKQTNLLYQTTQQVIQATTENDVISQLLSSFDQTDYVSAIFDVKDGYLSVIIIKDPSVAGSAGTGQGITLPLQRIITRLSEQSLIIFDDLSKPSDFDNILSFFSRRGCKSAAVFAILANEKINKVVVLGSRENVPLRPQDMHPYSELFEATGILLGRINKVSTLEQRLSELQIYENVSEIISVETDIEHLYQTLHKQLLALIGEGLSFLVAIYDKEHNLIHIPYMYEGEDRIAIDPFPLGEGLTSIVINTQKSLFLVNDTERKVKELGAKIIGRPAKSWMGVPLMVAGRILGAIVIQDVDQEERFTQQHLQLVTRLAPQIAITIRNVQLLTQMQAALRAFEQERQLLMTWLTNTPDLVYFKDAQGKYTRASNSYLEYLGVPSMEYIIGKTDAELLADETDSQITTTEEQDILQKGTSIIGKVEKRVDKNGNTRYYLVNKLPVQENPEEKSSGLLAIARDISAFHLAQNQSEKRAKQLEIAAQIARESSGSLDIDEVMRNSVNLVRERFDFYHSSIFLIDQLGEYAVLRESTGEAGLILKTAGHKLMVGSKSIIGKVTSSGKVMVVNDVTQDPDYYANPLLPETRAELAIPLTIGEMVLGALDVQSIMPDAFQEEDINVLQILADQLAITVFNANLFAQTKRNIDQHRLLHTITTTIASQQSLQDVLLSTVETLNHENFGDRICIFLNTRENVLEVRASSGLPNVQINDLQIPIGSGMIGEMAQAQREILVIDSLQTTGVQLLHPSSRSQMIVPISHSNRLLGMIVIESDQPGMYQDTDLEIIATLGNSLGAAMISVTLVEQVRQQVERQRLLFDITNKIRRAADIPTILETSASEIGKALRAQRARIQLSIDNVNLDESSNRGKEMETD